MYTKSVIFEGSNKDYRYKVLTYLNGLIPLCVNMCIFKFDLFWNNFPHREHDKDAPVVKLTCGIAAGVDELSDTFPVLRCTSRACRCTAAREPSNFKHNGHWNSLKDISENKNNSI